MSSPPAETGRLLIVEDDARLADLTAEYLQARGFTVAIERDGGRAVARILVERPDLVVLDLMLPGEDGLSICRRVRAEGYAGAIVMLTARGEEIDQVLGLEMGADDYVAKPVGPRLLLARIRTLLRRRGPAAPAAERIVDGALVIDRTARAVTVGGAPVELTTAEFDLLWLLAGRPGQAVTRQALFQALRGIDYDGIDRSMDVRVSQLRRKLAAAGADRIKTVRGVGYQFAPHR